MGTETIDILCFSHFSFLLKSLKPRMGTETSYWLFLKNMLQKLKSLKPRMGTETPIVFLLIDSLWIKIIKTPHGDGNLLIDLLNS